MTNPPIVFLHGWLMGPWMWDEAIAGLAGDRTYVALAQPSHGSPSLAAGSDMKDWSDWLIGELDARGIGFAVLVGHSMGGMLVLETVSRHPERVAGICIVSSTDTPWPPEVIEGFRGRAAALSAWNRDIAFGTANALLSPGFLQRNPEWLDWWLPTVAAYDRDGIIHLGEAFASRDDQRQIAASYDGPALVIHGTADPVFPIAVGEQLAGRLRAPLVRIDGSGHAPALESPVEFAAAFGEFLDEQFPAEA